MGASATAMQLALAFLLAVATVREAIAGSCPATPLTGCTQSSQVTLTSTSWTWIADGVDYTTGGPTNLPPTSPGAAQNHVLCVYDGMAALATDFVTPAAVAGALLFDSSDTTGGITLSSSQAGSITASFTWATGGLSAAKKAAAISQLISKNDKSCWAKAVSLKLPAGSDPDVPTELQKLGLNQATGLQVLNVLAARYNANADGEPLNLVTWLAALAPTQILSDLVGGSSPAGPADITPALSALHLAGAWGGAWFQRDGFQGFTKAIFSSDVNAAVQAYWTALSVPFSPSLLGLQSYANFILAIQSNNPTDFAGAAGSFGYNGGYTQLILTAGAAKGPEYVPPADVGLSCNFGKLFDCAITPNTIKVLGQLKDEVNKWSAALPTGSTAETTAVTVQQMQSAFGQFVWGIGTGTPPAGFPALVTLVKSEPAVWQSIYRVNNLFLEALQLAGRLLVRGLALALKSKTAGAAAALKEAALAQSCTSAWLSSYGLGLGTDLVLPQFDLGTTPLA